ncbi:DUF6351 family protein, partial [Variovorax sp. RHLX14]|uniref:c-type cytochrome n=1 Tax=Variovorax sp. RHLX14 TaxID=1259731 RepID=UPI003F482376
DLSFASLIQSDNTVGCGCLEAAHLTNVFNRAPNPNRIRCDLFQTNVNLLGKRPGTQEARRPMDNIGVQYGLAALNSGAISVTEFLDLNQKVGGYDGDGNTQAARSEADPDALKLTYAGGFKNSFKGPGLANIPIITQRGNADAVGDIHDTMQDLIIRARLQRANGRSDMAGTPVLAGQHSFYAITQLYLFREGRRDNPAMTAVAKTMKDEDLRGFSDFIATLPAVPAPPPATPADPARMARGQALAQEHRCLLCHGADLSGGQQVPRIAQQHEDYLQLSLQGFRTGKRPGYTQAMGEAVGRVPPEDLDTLAYYVARFPGAAPKPPPK